MECTINLKKKKTKGNMCLIHITDYFPDLRFSCSLVAARFFMFCNLLSAFISDVFAIVLFPDEDVLLLLDELVDLLEVLLPPIFSGKLCCLLKPAIKVEELLPLTELGESDRLLWKVIGLSRLLLDLGRVAVFFMDLLHSVQKKTDRGSLTSASLILG